MADGRVNKCKVCNRRDVQRNRQDKREYYRIHDSEREKRLDRKEKKRQRNIKRDKLFPEKRKANKIIGNLLRSGRLERKSCFVCGDPRAEAHHPDYSNPLLISWLCSACHHAIHAPEKMQPRAFDPNTKR